MEQQSQPINLDYSRTVSKEAGERIFARMNELHTQDLEARAKHSANNSEIPIPKKGDTTIAGIARHVEEIGYKREYLERALQEEDEKEKRRNGKRDYMNQFEKEKMVSKGFAISGVIALALSLGSCFYGRSKFPDIPVTEERAYYFHKINQIESVKKRATTLEETEKAEKELAKTYKDWNEFESRSEVLDYDEAVNYSIFGFGGISFSLFLLGSGGLLYHLNKKNLQHLVKE